jgi:cytochrome c6
MKNKLAWTLLINFISIILNTNKVLALNLELGEKIFDSNCIACHKGGNNIVIPEKNLKKLTLEANGINNKNGIIYQVLNGKNGMPAFGERLTENEIENVAEYVLIAAEKNFEF